MRPKTSQSRKEFQNFLHRCLTCTIICSTCTERGLHELSCELASSFPCRKFDQAREKNAKLVISLAQRISLASGEGRRFSRSNPVLCRFFALTSCTALKPFWFVVFVDSSIDSLSRLKTTVSHHGLDLWRLPGFPSLPCTFCILFSCECLLLAQPVA
jgi:hypothetical protein